MIFKIILDELGVPDSIIDNPAAYEILKEKILIMMKQYKDAYQDEKTVTEEEKIISDFNNVGIDTAGAEKALTERYFENVSVDDLIDFILFTLKKDKIKSETGQEIVFKVKNEKVIINERFFNSKEKTVISEIEGSDNIFIGKRQLYSTQHIYSEKSNRDDIMNTQLMIYDKNGDVVKGEKCIYHTEQDSPIDTYVYNKETNSFERVIGKRRLRSNNNHKRSFSSLKMKRPKGIKKVIQKSINKHKAFKRILDQDFGDR